MSRSFQSWRALLLPLICALLWLMPMTSARSGTVNCTITPVPNINLGTYDSASGSSASASVGWSCTNTDNQTAYVKLCINIGAGSGGVAPGGSRLLSDGAGHTLGYQLYKTAATDSGQIWGSPLTLPWTNVETTVPALSKSGGTASSVPVFTVYGNAPAGQTTNVVPGTYTSTFTNANALVYSYNLSGGGNQVWPADCSGGPSAANVAMLFTVTAKVVPACIVTAGAASNIQLGAASGVDSTATNITGNNTISVTCLSGTPYYIGLRPSNNNTGGAGVMDALNLAPVTGNTDSVPYQLRSTPGIAGTPWGNTATSTSMGNGMSGTGAGKAEDITVYATTPGANFVPDSYADTVTVIVNY